MTTRCGNWAQDVWHNTRAKRTCSLIRVVRNDGFVLAMTDHDRSITIDGITYVPVSFAGVSAERRDTGMKGSAQELYGIIDGDYVRIPDLLGDRYRGAMVYHTITLWDFPFNWVERQVKRIRSLTFTGSSWAAVTEGVVAQLTHPAGGRFGGVFSPTCTFRLGDPSSCKKVLTGQHIQQGVRVSSIVSQRMVFLTEETTWVTPYDPSYYEPATSGRATALVTTTTLTDDTKSWAIDEHAGRELEILSGAGGSVVHHRTISSNTANTLTFAALPGTFASGTYYDVMAFADDYYRDGDIVWRWSAPVDVGAASAGVTTSLLTDTTKSWSTDEHAGREVRILNAVNGAAEDWATIVSNTATTLTLDALSTTHLAGKRYDICGFCDNLEVVSPIVGYRDADRKLTLLFPTPFPIAVGDSGVVTVGCNGLKTTCRDKFDNLLNWGGDSDSPSAGKIIDRTYI